MEKLQKGLKELLIEVGEDPQRVESIDMPGRVYKMLSSFLTGYQTPVKDPLGTPHKIESTNHRDHVVIDNIPFCSMCEHHMVPFFGKMHISYIPNGWVMGLSRFSSYVDYQCRRLQIQENLGTSIIEGLYQRLNPHAISLKIVGMHACLAMEGKSAGGSRLITSNFRGDDNLRSQLEQSLHEYS